MNLRVGIDIGSTTVKVVVLDEHNKLLFRSYERHFSKTRERTCQTLRSVSQLLCGKEVKVILGFNTASEIFYENEFKALGCDVTVTTVDGSYGVKGFVTNALPENYTYFYTCGPEPMLKAVYKATNTSGQMSFEERMGCGFGACMGCSCKTITGYKRICKEGPVMKKEEILWEA